MATKNETTGGTTSGTTSGTSDESSRVPAIRGSEEPLPDLLTLDLAELGSIDHPVLREVVGELRARAAEPSEMLWGFDNSF